MNNESVKGAIAYTSAYILSLIVVVYLLKLPQRITGNQNLVDEYYYQNWKMSAILDYFLILAYLAAAYGVWRLFNIEKVFLQGIIVVLTAGALTTFFWWWITRTPIRQDSFFSRWFHTVGLSAAVYDMIILGVVFIVFQLIHVKL
jgi:hypothetical protein